MHGGYLAKCDYVYSYGHQQMWVSVFIDKGKLGCMYNPKFNRVRVTPLPNELPYAPPTMATRIPDGHGREVPSTEAA